MRMDLTAEEKKKKRNHDRYWNHREEQLRKNREWREKNSEYVRQWRADYRAGKKKISREDRLKRERVAYQKNRESILEQKRLRRMRPEVKAKGYTYQRERSKKFRAVNLIAKHKSKAKKEPGFVYLFESTTPGNYKVGFTEDWDRRRGGYTGPSSIKKLFFVRPTNDMRYAEAHLKLFLNAQGHYTQKNLKTDWFMKEDELVS